MRCERLACLNMTVLIRIRSGRQYSEACKSVRKKVHAPRSGKHGLLSERALAVSCSIHYGARRIFVIPNPAAFSSALHLYFVCAFACSGRIVTRHTEREDDFRNGLRLRSRRAVQRAFAVQGLMIDRLACSAKGRGPSLKFMRGSHQHLV
jgi:hypothetical protein